VFFQKYSAEFIGKGNHSIHWAPVLVWGINWMAVVCYWWISCDWQVKAPPTSSENRVIRILDEFNTIMILDIDMDIVLRGLASEGLY